MNENDETSEREKIIEKYRKGRSELEKDEIKEWEDPQFSIYQETDRYGFIHDHRLPATFSQYEAKLKDKENSRLNKWLKMIKAWDQYYPNDDKLRKRVYKGIPDRLRGKVWPKLLNIEILKQQQEGVYDRMLQYGIEASNDIRQIDLDVNRTYRNHRIFRERYNIRQQMLFRVLVAYSVYNTEVGYCQGMSQIAALLLMYMDEEDSFWCLSTLMSSEPHRMHGFFIPGFPKLLRFSKHHDKVVQKFLPKVCKHFKKFGIDSTLYTLKWFFQCFLDRVPFSLTLRIWDVFLLEGEDVLTAMSYTLLKLHKRSILSKSMEDTVHLLQVELEKDFGYHDDSAITELQRSMGELRKHKFLHPGETPDEELPMKEFGKLAFKSRSHLSDDRSSLAGSILLRPDTHSIATSKTSDAEADDSDSGEKISFYENVSVKESIEAAKTRSVSRSQEHSSNSIHTSENKTVRNGLILSDIIPDNEPSSSTLLLSNNTNQINNQTIDNDLIDNHRKEQTELIEKIAKLNQSVGNDDERVFIQRSEKTFILEDHRTDDVVTKEVGTTKSTFISVNNFTIGNSTISEYHSSVENKNKPIPIRINTTNSNGNKKIIEHPTSPSKIRIFVPYSEASEQNDSSKNTAKNLPAVET